MEWFPSPARVLSLWTLLIGSFNIAGLRPGSSVRAESLDVVKVTAVSGGEATLPCDTRSPQPPDVLLLVVWYKDDVPIYSFDGRVKGPTAHWADDSLGGRAAWIPSSPSALRLNKVLATDRAQYRCRVDFKVSPTKNHKIALDVIELPEKPKIFDELDKEVVGVAGPYIEDTSLKLTCVVSGGKPMPRVRWWRDDKPIQTLEPVEDGSRLSLLELKIPRLTRDYLEAVYTCTADNTLLVPPLRVNVQIQLYLRPLLVEILAREQPLSVGQEAELACRAVGARPPAIITWWLDGKQMAAAEPQKNSEDSNETVSFLRWTPRMEHDGRILTCRATHSTLEHVTLETTKLLSLHYMPIVVLQLGSKLNPNDIEEGDDVYFDCVVRAHPQAYKVVWEHNGQILTHNQRTGVIANSAHLAVQHVSRESAGKYVCTASNVEGDGRSAPVNLQIIYKPVCKNRAPAIVGAAINEAARVTCEVDAFPPPKNFQWTLNNSMGTVELEPAKFTINNGQSILTYTPTLEGDYGSLSCRATNLAGQQIEPCRYTLLPAVRPDPLFNCSSLNLTDDSVELRCMPGYDGGLHTIYFVEAWEQGMLIANASSIAPTWKLRGLGSGKTVKLIFYASNARGRSEIATLRIFTLSRLALHTEAKTANSHGMEAGWALGIVAGTLGTLLVVTIIALLARRRHHRPMQYEAPIQTVKAYIGSIQSTNHSPIQPDDKNPDVVPLGKDFNCARDVERPPEPPPYGAVVSPPVGASRSAHSLHQDLRSNTPHTPNTPASDVQVTTHYNNCSRDVERLPEPPPYGAVVSPPVGASRSAHSLHQDLRSNTPHTPNTPASDVQVTTHYNNCSRDVERLPEPPPYGAVVSPPVGASRSAHSLHQDLRSNTPHTPNTPASDVQVTTHYNNCSRDVERLPEPPPYGAVVSPPVGASRSAHSMHQDLRSNTPHTPNTPASDVQSIGTLADDRRSVTSGTLSRRREVVTTRTPLLANTRESCV